MQEPTDDATRGLEARYEVTKIDDPTGKHANCRVFVLDPQHDVKARKVLLEYAQLAAQDGQDQLAVDIIEWIGRVELAEHHPQLIEGLGEEVTVHEDVDALFEHLDRVAGTSPDEAPKVSPAPDEALKAICPVHQQSDCSPLLNGCSELTARVVREPGDGSPMDGLLDHFGVQGTFVTPPIENKGGYSQYTDPTDGKRI